MLAGETATKPATHSEAAFPAPKRPPLPEVSKRDWLQNPIDAFILARLERAGLEPSEPSDRRTLLRRLSFDLTGLPPTVPEQQRFLADQAPGAIERLVDRLLASPAYGERAAQHWLDLVRWAETDGFNQDAYRPLAWQYRDYVIRAMNDNLPYPRFITQQLAGDELEPDNPAAVIATGLNRLYPDEWNAGDLRRRRQEVLDDITETTSLVFLGLTMGCAQCHDHKFDAISQRDYFGLQAFFTPMLPQNELVIATPDERRQHAAQQAVWEEATSQTRAAMEAILGPHREKAYAAAVAKYDTELQQAIYTPEEKRSAYQKQLAYQASLIVGPKTADAVKSLTGDEKTAYEKLQQRLAEFDSLKPAPLRAALAIVDAPGPAPPTFRLQAGDVRRPQELIEPGFPKLAGGSEEVDPKVDSAKPRAALAQWLTRPDHPLTARVMVNRLWQQHFGEGIVSTPNDFGVMGVPATHPELLDWLAVELVECGGSLKHLHRLMVLSAAYQQSSLVSSQHPQHVRGVEKDPLNKLLWHARRRRLEGESFRDALLTISGELNPQMQGPSALPSLPPKISNHAWTPHPWPHDQHRRSIYILAKRNLRYPLLDAFDYPDMHHSCGRRMTTVTAPQALLVMNSDIVDGRVRHWAGKLLSSEVESGPLVRQAFQEAYGREPSADELADTTNWLTLRALAYEVGGEELSDASQPLPQQGVTLGRGAAVVDFCHALAGSNEFIYVD